MSQSPCLQRNSGRARISGYSMIPIGYTQCKTGIAIRSTCRCNDIGTGIPTTIKFKPIAIRSDGSFPSRRNIGKNIYHIFINLVLSQLYIRFTHSEHILPVVYHVFYLITIIGDQSHLKIGHYRIRFQCFLFIIITGARHFCNTDDIFMISQQRQVFYIFSRLSCLGEIHPIISCRRFSGTPSSYNQTHSVFTARSSVIATGIIYGSRGFESIDVADIGRIACYKMIIGRIDAHFLIIGNRNIKIT